LSGPAGREFNRQLEVGKDQKTSVALIKIRNQNLVHFEKYRKSSGAKVEFS